MRTRLPCQLSSNFELRLSLENLSAFRLFHLSKQDDAVTDIVHRRQRCQALWDMVDQFDERLRLPMILRYRYGLPCVDIAIILERRTSTIYQQLNEGRRLLEKMRQRQEEDVRPILAESSS